MAASDKVWHYEQVKIKDSEYAKKCGIAGDCYFYVSKGQIKISQLDNKTSLDLAISRIRTWGASASTFFLELGTRSPAGEGRLEMVHKDPNKLRLLVRETTSTRRPDQRPGPGRGPPGPQPEETETYYDAPPPAAGAKEGTYGGDGDSIGESNYSGGGSSTYGGGAAYSGAKDSSSKSSYQHDQKEDEYEQDYDYEETYQETAVTYNKKTYYGGGWNSK